MAKSSSSSARPTSSACWNKTEFEPRRHEVTKRFSDFELLFVASKDSEIAMAAKQMKFDTDARAEIAAGLSQLARAVKATLGPRGKNVVLQKSFGSPRITKDGVTVSKEIELPQPFENMGAKLVNMVASKTGDVAGDGTTTAVVLAEAIYGSGLKYVAAGGANPV